MRCYCGVLLPAETQLLYADDTLLLAESKEELNVSGFDDAFRRRKLRVNASEI